jgi:hypothetical protein
LVYHNDCDTGTGLEHRYVGIDTNESMPLPIKHRVIETDTQLVIEQEDTIHVHSEDDAVSVDRE